jgi:hypothetical protein
MKALAAIFVVALTVQAADLAVAVPLHVLAHPAKAWHSAPASRRWLAIADGLLESANAVDYITTRRDAFPGTGGCELNPVLTQAPCQIDVARFTAVKLAVAGFGLLQWAPVLNGLGGQSLVQALTIVDAAITLPLAIADVNNIRVLTKKQ